MATHPPSTAHCPLLALPDSVLQQIAAGVNDRRLAKELRSTCRLLRAVADAAVTRITLGPNQCDTISASAARWPSVQSLYFNGWFSDDMANDRACERSIFVFLQAAALHWPHLQCLDFAGPTAQSALAYVAAVIPRRLTSLSLFGHKDAAVNAHIAQLIPLCAPGLKRLCWGRWPGSVEADPQVLGELLGSLTALQHLDFGYAQQADGEYALPLAVLAPTLTSLELRSGARHINVSGGLAHLSGLQRIRLSGNVDKGGLFEAVAGLRQLVDFDCQFGRLGATPNADWVLSVSELSKLRGHPC